MALPYGMAGEASPPGACREALRVLPPGASLKKIKSFLDFAFALCHAVEREPAGVARFCGEFGALSQYKEGASVA
jgi:hypothetical protein